MKNIWNYLIPVVASILLTSTISYQFGKPWAYLAERYVPNVTCYKICPSYMPPQSWNTQLVPGNLVLDLLFWFVMTFILLLLVSELVRKRSC